MRAVYALGRATGDADLLARAREELTALIESAPAEHRATMRDAVPLHRAILG